MKNRVIEVLDKAYGSRVIEYWKSKGINTMCMNGDCTREDKCDNRYYGVINDKFGCYTISSVIKHNSEIIELTKEEKSFPRVMLVSDDGVTWNKRVVFMKKNDRYLAWNNAETIEDAECTYRVASWRYAKELPEKVELTKSEIAEKFGISIDQLVIKDD